MGSGEEVREAGREARRGGKQGERDDRQREARRAGADRQGQNVWAGL